MIRLQDDSLYLVRSYLSRVTKHPHNHRHDCGYHYCLLSYLMLLQAGEHLLGISEFIVELRERKSTLENHERLDNSHTSFRLVKVDPSHYWTNNIYHAVQVEIDNEECARLWIEVHYD